MTRRILIIGVSGQVGFELARAFQGAGELFLASRSGAPSDVDGVPVAIDLTSAEQLGRTIVELAPDVVINAAAHTAVDQAEDEPDLAHAVNCLAPRVMAAALQASGGLLVHYSTDYVFDGRLARPKTENDPTGPLNVYGRSKLAGEEAIRASGAAHLILRTSWVYSARGRNFVRTMLGLGATRRTVSVVSDQIGAPTATHELAALTRQICDQIDHPCSPDTWGAYHLTSDGAVSWYEFARAIFEEAITLGLLPLAPTAQPIASSAFSARAERPRDSRLDCNKARTRFGVAPRPWRLGLREVLEELAHQAPRKTG